MSVSEGLLHNKVVVVVGAGGGIGRAVALAAARAGARVVAADYGVPYEGGVPTSTVAEAVTGEILAEGGDAVSVAETVTTAAGAANIVQRGLDEWGRVDGAVCCQAIQTSATVAEMDEEVWAAMIATHLTGHFTIYQAAARAMTARGHGGSLVGFGSGYVQGTARRSAYRAAKAGVVGLTKSAALEMAEDGIRVNCVLPAANTRMTAEAGVVADGEPDDIAPLVVYLLSDLSADVTGAVVSVAGRRLAGWRDPFQNRFAATETAWTPETVAREMPYLLGLARVGTPAGNTPLMTDPSR
jgi:NAD(P)-dependent dehydrogenase (short-subunit alcohol dehydrogenase family)